MRQPLKEILGALGEVRVQFWACPRPGHERVTWTGDLASCGTHGCAMTSDLDPPREVLEQVAAALGRALLENDHRTGPRTGRRPRQDENVDVEVWWLARAVLMDPEVRAVLPGTTSAATARPSGTG